MLPSSGDDASAQADQSALLDLVGYNIRRAYLVIQALFDQEMEKHDLRQAEFSVLSVVRENPGINQRALEVISVKAKNDDPDLALCLADSPDQPINPVARLDEYFHARPPTLSRLFLDAR